MMGSGFCAAALLLLATAPTPPGVLDRARVGEWVTYRADGGGARVSYLRLAVVEAAVDSQGRAAVWVELEVATHPDFTSPLARLAVLAARSEGLARGGVTRFILAAGAGAPEEVPVERLDGFLPPALREVTTGQRTAPRTASTVGLPRRIERVVSTHAGTFTASCFDAVSDSVTLHSVCTHPAVPLFGWLVWELPSVGHSLRLHAYGTAARRRMLPGANRPTIGQER